MRHEIINGVRIVVLNNHDIDLLLHGGMVVAGKNTVISSTDYMDHMSEIEHTIYKE